MIHRITYEQFCTWLAFNQLDPFLDREDWRAMSIVNMIHNVNTTKEQNLTSVSDWMPRDIEKRIEDLDQEEEEERQREKLEDSKADGWNTFKKRLISSGRPIQNVFKG